MRRPPNFSELHEQFHQHHRGPGGHGRHRARRGALIPVILQLLGERPMHGYELITVLEERSGGRWKPSPGSVYPALAQLEERGLLRSTEDEGKRRYELTDAGRQFVAEMPERASAPWDDDDEIGRHGELRRAMAELVGPARQIGRFGSSEQQAAAVDAIKQATSTLYRLLADGR
jgi:DNA-binding PadR family transcriptional regulator